MFNFAKILCVWKRFIIVCYIITNCIHFIKYFLPYGWKLIFKFTFASQKFSNVCELKSQDTDEIWIYELKKTQVASFTSQFISKFIYFSCWCLLFMWEGVIRGKKCATYAHWLLRKGKFLRLLIFKWFPNYLSGTWSQLEATEKLHNTIEITAFNFYRTWNFGSEKIYDVNFFLSLLLTLTFFLYDNLIHISISKCTPTPPCMLCKHSKVGIMKLLWAFFYNFARFKWKFHFLMLFFFLRETWHIHTKFKALKFFQIINVPLFDFKFCAEISRRQFCNILTVQDSMKNGLCLKRFPSLQFSR